MQMKAGGEVMHFQRTVTLSDLFCPPSEKGSTLKGKNLLPKGSKFFPFRVDPFSEGAWCAEKPN